MQHEVKKLREQVARLEHELRALSARWLEALPDAAVRLAACAAAKEKALTALVERHNAALRDQLMQQQLFYAALHDKLSRAPLGRSSAPSAALFAALHAPLRLGRGERERREALTHRLDRGIAGALGIMDAFTADAVPRASPVLPYSATSISALPAPSAGDRAGTLVSNVFVCKLPAETDVARVFRIVVENLRAAPVEVRARLGIHLEFSVLPLADHVLSLCTLSVHPLMLISLCLNVLALYMLIIYTQVLEALGPDRVYGHCVRHDGEFRGVATSAAFASELVTSELGVAIMDFVDEDDEHPVGSVGTAAYASPTSPASSVASSNASNEPELRLDTCTLMTVNRAADPVTGEAAVLLRRIRVHRYNLPPQSPKLHRDLELHLPYLNGDLHMEMLSAAVARGDMARTPPPVGGSARSKTEQQQQEKK